MAEEEKKEVRKEEEKKEVKLPITFSGKCPVCGNTQGIVRSILEREKAKGKIGKEKQTGLAVTAVLADPTRLALTFPMLVVFLEVCSNPECGAVYALHASEIEVKGEMSYGGARQQMPNQKPFGFQGNPAMG